MFFTSWHINEYLDSFSYMWVCVLRDKCQINVHLLSQICKFQIHELPKPSFTNKTLRELRIGTFENIETATEETSIILALKKFVERRVSALPIVDSEGKLVNIYSKFDVIVSYMCF